MSVLLTFPCITTGEEVKRMGVIPYRMMTKLAAVPP